MRKQPFSLFLLFLFAILRYGRTATATTYLLEPGQKITRNETLVSPDGTFALGFFQPGNTSKNLYLGIWYNDIPKRTPVWVANREQPLADSGAFLTMTKDRNLALMDPNGSPPWSTNVSSVPNGTVAILLESGNLVLRKGNGDDVWQSFDHPTDTFLPEMKLSYDEATGLGQRMVAWKHADDPSHGEFSLGFFNFQIFVWRRNRTYWRTNVMVTSLNLWSLNDGNPYALHVSREANISSVVFSGIGASSHARCTIEPTGEMKLMMWENKTKDWATLWSRPRFCDFYGGCGLWGACDSAAQPPTCRCLHGFVPKNETEWERSAFSSGCVRRVPLLFTRDEKFLLVENTKLPDGFTLMEKPNESECRYECLSRSQCTAYSFSNASVVGDACLVWNGDLTDLQMPNLTQGHLNIRLVASELDIPIKLNKSLLLLLLFAVAILVAAGSFFFVKRLRLEGIRRARREMRLEGLFFSDAFRGGGEFPEALLVDFKDVVAATSDFSHANKLGEGGFGSVYKGILASGHEVAVKRLSTISKQGQLEFANEVGLIAKLQHKNLVRLLGWCIHGDEKILIYEYMPNNSLDKFIFGKSKELEWDKRFAIIVGIADGLLYLHHHSRMRVIHRDLKTSNILLDSEMVPKIADFGLAKIIEINETEGNTRKIAGTLGYMSPEYALDGVFSEKSDVFSFGVIVLEVITGRRSTRNCVGRESLNLLGHAWLLWSEGRAPDLMEPLVRSSTQVDKALRCIQVGLLCVEENAADRPTMNTVVSMLTNESYLLPLPKNPAFNFRGKQRLRPQESSTSSVNVLSDAVLEGR